MATTEQQLQQALAGMQEMGQRLNQMELRVTTAESEKAQME